MIINREQLKYPDDNDIRYKYCKKTCKCYSKYQVFNPCTQECNEEYKKSCHKAWTLIEIIGEKSSIINLLIRLGEHSIQVEYANYPVAVYYGKHITGLKIRNTSLTDKFDEIIKEFDNLYLNGVNPFY